MFRKKETNQAFVDACKKIEENENYRPNISNKEMLKLACGNNKEPTYSVIAIYPATKDFKYPEGGRIYLMKLIATNSCDIDDYYAIHVNSLGKTSIHKQTSAKAGYFKTPIKYLCIDKFLAKGEAKNTEPTGP